MKPVSPLLLERLRELALVEVDMLVSRLDTKTAVAVLGAYVADLEDALGQVRTTVRDAHAELGKGAEPLILVDQPPHLRAGGGEPAMSDAAARLRARASARRELARLEDLAHDVLPRLLEADRRFLALGGVR